MLIFIGVFICFYFILFIYGNYLSILGSRYRDGVGRKIFLLGEVGNICEKLEEEIEFGSILIKL